MDISTIPEASLQTTPPRPLYHKLSPPNFLPHVHQFPPIIGQPSYHICSSLSKRFCNPIPYLLRRERHPISLYGNRYNSKTAHKIPLDSITRSSTTPSEAVNINHQTMAWRCSSNPRYTLHHLAHTYLTRRGITSFACPVERGQLTVEDL